MKKLLLISLCFFIQWRKCEAQTSHDRVTPAYTDIEKQIKLVDSLLIDGSSLKKADELLKSLHTTEIFENYPAFRPWIYYYEAQSLFYKSDYINSIILLNQAASSLKKLPEDVKTLRCKIKVYNLVGLAYSDINDFENAQSNYQNALLYALQIKDSSLVAKIYMNSAFIYIDYQDWKNAVVNLNKSLDFISKTGPNEYHATIYASLANANILLGNKDESWKYIKISDSIFKKEPSARAGLFNSLCRAEYYYFQNQCDKALPYASKSLHYAKLFGDSIYITVALEQNARIERCNKNYDAASGYLSNAVQIADRRNYLGLRNLVYYEKMFLLKETGAYKEAFETSLKLINLTDSLTIVMNNNRRIINDAAFESDQKEKKISLLAEENKIQEYQIKQKNILNYVLIGSAATILIISLLSYRNYRHKQKLQQQRITELETEKHLAATEAVLKGEELERARLAKDLHDGLGGMLSGIKYSLTSMKGNLIMTPDSAQAFERSMDMLDSSIHEMRRVAHNMMPEALVKFGLDVALKDFCSGITHSGALKVQYQSINMEDLKIDQTTSITLYRIVQELIHNTIKHASAKNAIVQISKTDDRLNLEVEDDGIGFNIDELDRAKGIGWGNIQNRIEFLKGKLDIHSEIGKGTSVHIELNV
jgi:signal transduction histidine kinase